MASLVKELLNHQLTSADTVVKPVEMSCSSWALSMGSTGLSQTAFAKQAGVPLRTVQDWRAARRSCPGWVRFLLAEHYRLL